jgi:ribose 5-phosphate isomerase A
MGELSFVDIAIDGADQIDPEWRMIKGGGGALFREKIVAAAARQMIIVADSSKLAPALGHRPLPVEVHPFAFASVQQTLAKLDYPTALRKTPNGAPFITEQNALILDLRIGLIEQPEELAVRLDAIPGILAHGLFIGAADRVIIGSSRTGGTRDHS